MRALAFAALAICVSFAAAADEVRKPEYFFGRYVGGAEIQGGSRSIRASRAASR